MNQPVQEKPKWWKGGFSSTEPKSGNPTVPDHPDPPPPPPEKKAVDIVINQPPNPPEEETLDEVATIPEGPVMCEYGVTRDDVVQPCGREAKWVHPDYRDDEAAFVCGVHKNVWNRIAKASGGPECTPLED